MSDEKPYRSASQIDLCLKCPEAYRRRYLEGEKRPPGIALIKGLACHHGAAENFKQKIESHADLKPAEVAEIAVSQFERELKAGFKLDPEDGNAAVAIGTAKDSVVEMAEAHIEMQAPDYQPVFVEQAVRIELPESTHDLLGVLDLADDQGRVIDFKTAGKSKSQNDADTNTGLTVYAAAYHVLTGQPPSELRLDTLVQGKRETKRQVLPTSRDDADFAAFSSRLDQVNTLIAAGIFPPATAMAWWCAPRWCGYYDTCRFVNPGKRTQND